MTTYFHTKFKTKYRPMFCLNLCKYFSVKIKEQSILKGFNPLRRKLLGEFIFITSSHLFITRTYSRFVSFFIITWKAQFARKIIRFHCSACFLPNITILETNSHKIRLYQLLFIFNSLSSLSYELLSSGNWEYLLRKYWISNANGTSHAVLSLFILAILISKDIVSSNVYDSVYNSSSKDTSCNWSSV